jgi:hypothetical protein
MALLSLLATTLVRAEETIDSRADYVLDCVDRGKYLETEGYSRVAFTTFAYSRHQWLLLHKWSPKWNPAEFDATLDEIDLHLAKIKDDLKGQGQAPPPEIDQAFYEFLDIALGWSKDLEISRRRLQDLEKFQKEHPRWEPQLIAKMVSDTRKVIADASSGG